MMFFKDSFKNEDVIKIKGGFCLINASKIIRLVCNIESQPCKSQECSNTTDFFSEIIRSIHG